VSLADNILHAEALFNNHTFFSWNPKYHVSFRSLMRKCFTIDGPEADQSFNSFHIYIKKDIFPKERRPEWRNGELFISYLHYAGQRFTAYYTSKYDWKPRTNNSENYSMIFKVKNVDVIRHRWKPKKRCFQDWKKYDQSVMDDIMLKVKCHPPHWNPTTNLALCTNSTEMSNFRTQPTLAYIEKFDPPCKVIQRLDYVYNEHGHDGYDIDKEE
jgi:hypothetical protein